MLSEECDPQSTVSDEVALRCLQVSDEQLDPEDSPQISASARPARSKTERAENAQGRFSRSVRTDDGDSRVESDVDVDVLEDDLLGSIAEGDVVELK